MKFEDDIQDSDVCIQAKAVSVRLKNSEPLKRIHADIMGPISSGSFQVGNRYIIITFIDDATRYVWAYPMPNKTSVHLTVSKLLENIIQLEGQNASI